jgi:hypothetical protein
LDAPGETRIVTAATDEPTLIRSMTIRIRRIGALLLLPLLAACDGDALTPRGVVGRWQFTAESTGVEWRRDDVRLVLEEDGTYLRTHLVFADDGRPSDHLRAYRILHGTYEVRGDSLFASLSLIEEWDVRMVVPEPRMVNPGFGASERFRARLTGSQLLLEETRDVDGMPVTYHHTFRSVARFGDSSSRLDR